MKLLKEVKSRRFSTEYYVKLFADTETGKYSVYANNSNFNWGYNYVFDTLEEAEKHFNKTLETFDYKN